MSEHNPVERFRNVMHFRAFDRLPVIEWATWWDKTIKRWRGEGLSEDPGDGAAIRSGFGQDEWRQLWINAVGPGCPKPTHHGAGLIADEAGYRALKRHLYPDPPFDAATLRSWADGHARGETVVWITLPGFFWFPRQLFGIERHLYAFYDQPDLMRRMNRDLLAFNLNTVQTLCEILTPDFMTFAEDMSYNHGPMLSETMFEEFLAPCYRENTALLRRRGIIPIVDSDGDVTVMIPWLERVGVEGILPLERMAGVDVAEIRRRHPRFRMIGAFDKTVMHKGEAAMRREFERLLPVMKTGGFIPSVDHQTPPDVSLEMYRVYMRLLREYCEKAACSGTPAQECN